MGGCFGGFTPKTPPRYLWAEQLLIFNLCERVYRGSDRIGLASPTKFWSLYSFAIGGALSGDFVRERSLEGIALVSGFHVGEMLA